jgi:hypothetical protein
VSWEDLVYHGLIVRPWDGSKPRCSYRRSQFSASLSKTLRLLSRELGNLNATKLVVLLDVSERDIRLDGAPRANARIGEPCVAVSFESKHGPVRMVTGEYSTWQDNLRAVALSLEALRSVDRYGVSKSGEQYRGWRAIPASTDGADLIATEELALEYISQWMVPFEDDLDSALRKALFDTHPHHGGDPEEFRKVVRARDLLRTGSLVRR